MVSWEDLDSEDTWNGNRIVDLEDDHLVNLKGFLFKHAVRFHSSMIMTMYSFSNTLRGEMAIDSMDIEISRAEEEDPLLWMEQRPILRAINREIAKRQGYSVCRVIETE